MDWLSRKNLENNEILFDKMFFNYFINTIKIYLMVTFVILFLLYLWLNFFHFTYKDASADCIIKIKTPTFVWNINETKRALRILKYGVPEEYEKVCRHVEIINSRKESCSLRAAGCYKGRSDPSSKYEISVNPSDQSFSAFEAAAIAHETCHLIQNIEDRMVGGSVSVEPECYKISNKVVKMVVQY